MQSTTNNIIALGGLGLLTAAGWILHPSIGLTVLGVAAIAVAIGNVLLQKRVP